MNIKRKIISGFIVGMGFIAGISALNISYSLNLGKDLEYQTENMEEQRHQLLADQFHDTIRGDIYSSYFDARNKGNSADRIKQGFEYHSKQLIEHFSEVKHSDQELTTEQIKINKDLVEYINTAKKIINISYSNIDEFDKEIKEFENQYNIVQKDLTEFGMKLKNYINKNAEHAEIDRVRSMWISIVGTILILLIAVIALAFILRIVLRPLDTLRLSLGEKTVSSELTKLSSRAAEDEIGILAGSLIKFKESAQEAIRIRFALDTSSTNVMIIDQNQSVLFVNQALAKLMHDFAPDFRQALGSFDPDRLVGSSMAAFLRSPSTGGNAILVQRGDTSERLKIGSRTIELACSPVVDDDGNQAGALLEWRDLTVEQAAQDEVGAMVNAAAEGDFSKRVPLEGKSGFLREIAKSMNELGTMVDSASTDFAQTIGAVAQGDLTRSVTADYKGRFGEVKDAINETTSKLAQLVRTIQSTTLDVAASAKEITSGSDDLSQRTESQAASLEETAATTEELAASVKASAQASRNAVSLADEAMKVAVNGGDIVKQAVDAMARIEQASRKISDITGVIDEIAFQTNLLALNAAVEAARAGDAGKGFAVVASEVRSLAQRSSEAAKDISGLIQSSTGEVSQGVQLVRSAGDALHEIVEASRKVSGTVSEISTAASEQANGIDEMSQTVAQMDEMTQQNAALAEQSAASAVSLNDQISRLNALVATFRTGQDGFADAASSSRGISEPERRRRMAQAAFTPRTGSSAA
jgi:methyl-accepting chemotaxis protein